MNRVYLSLLVVALTASVAMAQYCPITGRPLNPNTPPAPQMSGPPPVNIQANDQMRRQQEFQRAQMTAQHQMQSAQMALQQRQQIANMENQHYNQNNPGRPQDQATMQRQQQEFQTAGQAIQQRFQEEMRRAQESLNRR